MTFDAASARLFIASETEWDSEPSLSEAQQDFLLEAAKATATTYTIASIGAAIYLGLSWKLKKAIEYHEGDESKIFDHLKEVMERWSIYASSDLGLPGSSLQYVEIEVGANFV
jgi:hypothetical protein